MNNANFEYKHQQQLIQMITTLIDNKLKNLQIPKFLYGKVVKIDVNSYFADVEISYNNICVLEKINNKTGFKLNIGDIVTIIAPMGNFTNCFISNICRDIPKLIADTIEDLDFTNISTTGDLSDINSISTKYLSCDNFNTNINLDFICNSVETNNVTSQNITTQNLISTSTASTNITTDNLNLRINGVNCKSYKTINNWVGDAGISNTIDNTITITLDSNLKQIMDITQYFVKFYPNESCNYSITKTENDFTIETDKDVSFGWEVMGMVKEV